jgi:hypothetical protein
MAGDESEFEWDDLPPKLVVADPEDLVPPTREWDELEMTTPPVAATDPLVATFTDLDLVPPAVQGRTPEQNGVTTDDADWVD